MAAELETLRKLAEELINQVDDFQSNLLPSNLRLLPEQLQTGQLTLAVLGQFKRGKSTLINALLGAKLMPTSVLPITSVLTRTIYGEKPGLLIHFTDGRDEHHVVDAISEFVTEEKNPENKKGVQWAEVRWPSDFLRRPVQLVDTPGVGSVYNHNTETSEAFLGHLDAAIFVLGVDPVLTQTEIEWLVKVKNEGERFFFVLNKVDQLTKPEIEQVMEFAHARLKEIWGNAGRIYPLSAKKALTDPHDPDFSAFRHDLTSFLDSEAEETLYRSSRRKLVRGIQVILTFIELEREAASRPVEKMRSWLQNLNTEEKKLTLERAKAYWVMDEAHTKLLAELYSLFDKHWESIREETRNDVEIAWENASTIGKARMAMKDALEERLKTMFAVLKPKGDAACDIHSEQAIDFLINEYQELANRLVKNTANTINVDLPQVELEIPKSGRGRFYVEVSPELVGISSAGGSLINLLPRAWGKYFGKRAFLKQLDQFYEMQKSRLLDDVSDRFEDRGRAVVASLIETTKQFLQRIKDAIEKGLAIQERSEAEREAVINDLLNREAALKTLMEKCFDLTQ